MNAKIGRITSNTAKPESDESIENFLNYWPQFHVSIFLQCILEI